MNSNYVNITRHIINFCKYVFSLQILLHFVVILTLTYQQRYDQTWALFGSLQQYIHPWLFILNGLLLIIFCTRVAFFLKPALSTNSKIHCSPRLLIDCIFISLGLGIALWIFFTNKNIHAHWPDYVFYICFVLIIPCLIIIPYLIILSFFFKILAPFIQKPANNKTKHVGQKENEESFLEDTSKEDILDRDLFVSNLKEKISTHAQDNKNSFTIGLQGKWGEGKTHVLDMLKKQMEQKNDFIVVKMSSWSYINDENSDVHFINCLYKNIINNITQQFYIPELNCAFSNYLKSINTITANGQVYGLPFSIGINTYNNNTVEKEKKKISDVIEKIDKTLLIIIDDLDRLCAKEILAVLKAVRSHLDFSKTIFILAYDPAELERQLKTENIKEDYIHKIVQLEIKLPEISQDKVSKYLQNELAKIPGLEKMEPIELFDKPSIGSAFIYNLRHAKRLINSIKFNFLPLKNKINFASEINFADFVHLEILKQNHPKVYSDIINNPKAYLGKHPYFNAEALHQDVKKRGISSKDYIIRITENNTNIQKLLAALFSKIAGEFYPEFAISKYPSEQSIDNPHYFHRYFRDTIPEYQVPDAEINEKLKYWLEKKAEAEKDLHEYLHEYFKELKGPRLLYFFDVVKKRIKNNQPEDSQIIALLILNEISNNETEYSTIKEFDLYDKLLDFLALLSEDNLSQTVNELVRKLSFYNAARLVDPRPERHNIKNMKDSIINIDKIDGIINNNIPTILDRFKDQFIDKKSNLTDLDKEEGTDIKEGQYIWFLVLNLQSKSTEKLDLKGYIKNTLLTNEENFLKFIKYYEFNEFTEPYNHQSNDNILQSFLNSAFLDTLWEIKEKFTFSPNDNNLIIKVLEHFNTLLLNSATK
jgi:hypothetical protein